MKTNALKVFEELMRLDEEQGARLDRVIIRKLDPGLLDMADRYYVARRKNTPRDKPSPED